MTLDAGTGLTRAEVDQRRADGLVNTVTSGQRSNWQIASANLFTFFNNLLFVIGIALIALGKYNDAFTSVGLGFINGLIGTVQEIRAKRQLEAISVARAGRAQVVREGQIVEIAPAEIVLDDVLVVSPGGEILVDGVLLGEGELTVDESLLTGESAPVVRRSGDLLSSGSVVVGGHGRYRATAVGDDTVAAGLTRAARATRATVTPMQNDVTIIVRIITLVVALMSFAILFQALLEKFAMDRIVQVSAVLSGQIPNGLFFLIALAYAVGAAGLSTQGALVQQSNAVEGIAAVDTICLDKTGTLTTGALTFSQWQPLVAVSDHDELRAALGAYATRHRDDPAGQALAEEFSDGSGTPVRAEWTTLTVGSPEEYAGADQWRTTVDRWAEAGERVLLLSAASGPVALVSFTEEVRSDAAAALASLHDQGVALRIISGDAPRTVAAVARRAGIETPTTLTGAEIDALSDGDLTEVVDDTVVYARTTPAHKERIVRALQRRGHRVAMIGDGANDVAALKVADVAVAVESGAQIARDVSDMVLLGDSFAALDPAVREGRRIVDGLYKSLLLFIPRVITSILVIIFVTMLGLGFPYAPAQVALTLFTVGIPSLALTMWARPEPVRPGLLRRVMEFALPAGIVTAIFATSIYAIFYELIASSVSVSRIPPGAETTWAKFTGVAVDSPAFAAAAATIIAQTAMSTFIAFASFTLILFVEPPARLFSGWAPVSPDRRPLWLALALTAIYVAVLEIQPAASYFGLLTPHGPEWMVYAVALPLWVVILRTLWRHRLFSRLLGLPPQP